MACNPIAEGKSDKSGDSRRHVGGGRSSVVKPWKWNSDGRQPLHTMYVGGEYPVLKPPQIDQQWLKKPSLRRKNKTNTLEYSAFVGTSAALSPGP